jgi:hypothetical protein
MGIGKDGFLAVAPSAPPTPSRGIIDYHLWGMVRLDGWVLGGLVNSACHTWLMPLSCMGGLTVHQDDPALSRLLGYKCAL